MGGEGFCLWEECEDYAKNRFEEEYGNFSEEEKRGKFTKKRERAEAKYHFFQRE